MVDLFGAASFDQVVERVKKFAIEHPEEKWIKGRGWDQNKWPGKSYPTNEKSNQAFPEIPVILTRADGHAAIVNQKTPDLVEIHPGQTLTGVEIKTGTQSSQAFKPITTGDDVYWGMKVF